MKTPTPLLAEFDRNTYSALARSFVQTVPLCGIGCPSARGQDIHSGHLAFVEAPLHHKRIEDIGTGGKAGGGAIGVGQHRGDNRRVRWRRM